MTIASRTYRISFIICSGSVFLASCSRAVQGPTNCPLDPGYHADLSAIVWERTSDVKPVTGSVVRAAPFVPLVAANITLRPLMSDGADTQRSRGISTDSSGRFAFDSIPGGRYLLTIRRIGFKPISDTIDVASGLSVTALAVMATDQPDYIQCELVTPVKPAP